ncbi:MAG: long-chain fatty acid--CoA ligase [Acidobacteria bacterium]|nr:long-chain fatty acid--CoA ligase [Acidobacteriota bacterium]
MIEDRPSTLAELPFYLLARHPKPVLLRTCQVDGFRDFSTREFCYEVRDLSVGLAMLGMAAGDSVAIVSESRPEWEIADLAILTGGATTVPIYPTLAAAQARYILADADVRIAIASTERQAAKILEVRRTLPRLRHVMVMDPPENATSVTPLSDVRRRGRTELDAHPSAAADYQARARRVSPEDVATIIYTSGTTGEPKGVVLSHANLLSNVFATTEVLGIRSDDVALSFLPLSHGFERMAFYMYIFNGVTIAFAESFDTIARDVLAVKPTVMTGVPRVFEKLRARILASVAQSWAPRRALFAWALRVGLERWRAESAGGNPPPLVRAQAILADTLVFSKIRARLGGHLRCLISGSAPLSPSIADFFFAIGLPLLEGYGLTETSPVLTVNPPLAPRVGTVGKALPGVEIRIAEGGEILARGPNVMIGYHRKKAATAEALAGGWFHTGDIGEIDRDGYLKITDRKKDLLVTSGGKKIAPQPIEARLKANPLIAETLVIGDRRKFPSLLIVPDFATLERRARQLGVATGARDALVRSPEIVQLYEEFVDEVNKDLAQFERIKRFVILPVEFTMESGELTPTLKVKRKVVEERWKDTIDAMYVGNEE